MATVSSENKAISDAARAFHRVHVPAVSRPPFLPGVINVPPVSRPALIALEGGAGGEGETERGRGGMSIRNENRADRQTGTSKLVKKEKGGNIYILWNNRPRRNLSFGSNRERGNIVRVDSKVGFVSLKRRGGDDNVVPKIFISSLSKRDITKNIPPEGISIIGA